MLEKFFLGVDERGHIGNTLRALRLVRDYFSRSSSVRWLLRKASRLGRRFVVVIVVIVVVIRRNRIGRRCALGFPRNGRRYGHDPLNHGLHVEFVLKKGLKSMVKEQTFTKVKLVR